MDVSNATKTIPDLSELPAEHGVETPPGNLSRTSSGGAISGTSSPCAVLQTSFTGEMCNREWTDLEARKSCEARWLQLFQLVERQCQDQIDAQQEQFNNQMQLIHDEIKHLVKEQGRRSQQNPCQEDATGSNTPSLGIHAVQYPDDHERREAVTNHFPIPSELEMQQKAFCTQDNFLDSTSVSSGYGTHSAFEPNACVSGCDQNATWDSGLCTGKASKEGRDESLNNNLTLAPLGHERPVIQVSDQKCRLLTPEKSSEEVLFTSEPVGSCLPSDKSNKERSNCKPLTTWAQKLKPNHQKSNPSEPVSLPPVCANPPRDEAASGNAENMDASAYTFYLDNRTESTNSLVSAGSGLTYWRLDEKEMYHSLPENFEMGLSKLFSTKESDEARMPSLTHLYQRKQRESNHYPDWKSPSPAEHTHPPEVLTLDPTLHRKPQHRFHNTDNSGIPSTPDSILGNDSVNYYDAESVSPATSSSSLLGECPNRSPHQHQGTDLDQWKAIRFQNIVNMNYAPSLSDASRDERVICTDDETNSSSRSSIAQSPVPCSEEGTSESTNFLSADHPLMLSKIRRSLREKHGRHLADLRDYYESEMNNLKQQIHANSTSSAPEDLRKIHSLSERCDHMEGALTEASTRIRILENKNNDLEMEVTDWRERFHATNGTAKALQERVEEMRTQSKERENAISRLQSKLKDVGEAFEKAVRLSGDKDARIQQENKMFQDLLSEYESLGKEHERVKDTLNITENKLCDAQTEINELKRTVSKLEAQIKQVEHENMMKLRHIAEGQLWQSGANNFRTVDVVKRKCLTPAECSIFTGQPLDNKARDADNMQETAYVPNRYHSPPERDPSHDTLATKLKRQDGGSRDSPIIKAMRDFEDKKASESWGTETEKENAAYKLSSRRETIGFVDRWSPRGSPEKHRDRQRRLNSPSPRSSSLPPSNRKPTSVTTPTKRELMLAPMSVKYSPKRSPRENLSPGFSQLQRNEENTVTRFDVVWDDPPTFKDPSPRKRLQFTSHEDPEVRKSFLSPGTPPRRSKDPLAPFLVTPYETEFTFRERRKKIADTEKLFDELIHEKQQIEAVLSRMPCPGGRSSLQSRVEKETLEDRLEKINQELGSIRMTLRKSHVLPTSANI
ncbi:hypothetical protein FKM82_005067 [Ascaphus truei]